MSTAKHPERRQHQEHEQDELDDGVARIHDPSIYNRTSAHPFKYPRKWTRSRRGRAPSTARPHDAAGYHFRSINRWVFMTSAAENRKK